MMASPIPILAISIPTGEMVAPVPDNFNYLTGPTEFHNKYKAILQYLHNAFNVDPKQN